MLHFRRAGKGRTVVLQHGFLGGSGYWEPQVERLASGFDVIAPDLPGFAHSAAEPAPVTIEGFADALVTFLDSLGIERFMLVGHSLGGIVAQQAALDYPDRIEKLVLYGTTPSGRLPGRFETVEASVERIRTEGIEAHARRVIPTWFVDGERSPRFQMCWEAGQGLLAEVAAATMKAIAAWDVVERLGELAMRTLVVCGDLDTACPVTEALRLWHAIANARLCILPRCGHNAHLEKPRVFDPVLVDFLEE